jgi:hypothetical protein
MDTDNLQSSTSLFINIHNQVHISSLSNHSQVAYAYVKRGKYNSVRDIIKN